MRFSQGVVSATLATLSVSLVWLSVPRRPAAGLPSANGLAFSNPAGVQRTVTLADAIDETNPFFEELGTNGRTCFTCHRPAQAWTITPAEIQERFDRTAGFDPIFRTNDGSNCAAAEVATLEDRRASFSLLLTKGLIRIALDVPSDAEFEIVDIDDPYRCPSSFTSVSMHRRPLPTTNLAFLSSVMWDGRETVAGHAVAADLMTQALRATTGHAEGAPPSPSQLRAIVDFELGLFTAQTQERSAGTLTQHGVRGGPVPLTTQPFCIGLNDPLNMRPAVPGACASASVFDPKVFTIFSAWRNDPSPARRAIARGEEIFNTRPFVIDNVPGLNAAASDPVSGPIENGTCTICHDTPNVGNHSVSLSLDLGIADASNRTPDLPLYTLRNKTTGALSQTTDPGRAMVTGKWADIGKFKGPILRTLAARPPYFHNGSAATLADVVDVYDRRFHIGLTEREKADLIAFLGAL